MTQLFTMPGHQLFDPQRGELILGWGVSIMPTEMAHVLARASRSAGHAPGDVRDFPVWTVLTTEVMPLRYDAPRRVARQMVCAADVAFAMLGGLQGWCERALGELPVGVADQMDQLRADALRRFKVGAAQYDRQQR